jgi:hypothetical protein
MKVNDILKWLFQLCPQKLRIISVISVFLFFYFLAIRIKSWHFFFRAFNRFNGICKVDGDFNSSDGQFCCEIILLITNFLKPFIKPSNFVNNGMLYKIWLNDLLMSEISEFRIPEVDIKFPKSCFILTSSFYKFVLEVSEFVIIWSHKWLRFVF